KHLLLSNTSPAKENFFWMTASRKVVSRPSILELFALWKLAPATHHESGGPSSRFENSAPPKHDGAMALPTKVVPMDLSEEYANGSNIQSLRKSPMDRGSTPLDRTD
ncbi:hypothetical protein KXW63_009309, partial [Aspergillus fumigatus]